MIAALLLAAACHDVAHHQRDAMKHRKTPAVMVANPPVATVGSMVAWPVPVILAKRADVPVDPRERQVYQLTGYVRLLKQSEDDCDLHVQLADQPDGDVQVIVEIPLEQTEARTTLQQLVDADPAARVTVTGYAFLDLAHANASDRWTKEGYGHGDARVKTLWELHPVFKVEKAE
jgi:hypothetical protein